MYRLNNFFHGKNVETMKISLNWLNDYVDLAGEKPEELGLRFTMASAEIEGIEDLGKDFNNVITAKILEIAPHPDADKLQVTKVDNGKEILQVVCGAKNIAVGQIIPLAQVGAVLPGDFKIKVSNKRGVESFGMLCSPNELGVSGDADGILILPENTETGRPFAEISGKNDSLIDIDNKSLTHRPDLWGHYGIAREFSAILKKQFKPLDFTIPAPDQEKTEIKVTIENPELCQRYSALAFDNIKIGPSPRWLQERLVNTGNKPINNVVDATNYVMFELGQPLHSFDGSKLQDNTIVIRTARPGETLTTLDGVERNLTEDMLVIADQANAIALAGVMGNENSEVDENTTFVILESANFHPASVRRTALKLGLRTEASARFEKSLDPEMTVQAISRFYQIMKESCPDIKVVSKLADLDYSNKEPVFVEVSREFINRRLGTNLDNRFITETLKNLGFAVTETGNEYYRLKVPTYRATKDIGIPEDIVEEIGRIYGYDNINPVAPQLPVEPLQEQPLHILRRQLRNLFSVGFGFKEVYNYSFNGTRQLEKLNFDPENHIRLQNPLSQDQEYLRTSLIPNMLEVVAKNIRNFNDFNLYELGKVFIKEGKTEKEYLCAFSVTKKPEVEPFYTAKGYAEKLLEKIGITDFEIRFPGPEDHLESFYHPGRTGFLAQRRLELGVVSEIHPKVLQDFDINGKISFLYLDIAALLQAVKKKEKFKELPKYPHVPFDISVMVDKRTLVTDVRKTIEKVNKQLIRDIELFDIYEGKNLAENMKSLAFTINFYSRERTLEPQEIKDLQNGVMKALNDKGYEVRG
jgi:phenylalanyl-tRNA synthetase beta chain